MQEIKKAAIYARISTLSHIHGQDLMNQITPIRELAKSRGLTIIQEYSDEGISGARERRPALDAMLADAKRGKFKYLIVMEISRLARDTRHLLNLLFELEQIGCSVISIREGIQFDTPMGKAMVAMIGIMMTVEKDLLRERIKSALQTKRLAAQAAGKRFNIGRPTVITPELAQKVIDLRAKGHSIRQISKLVQSPTGSPLGKTTVERVLREARTKSNCPESPSKPAINRRCNAKK